MKGIVKGLLLIIRIDNDEKVASKKHNQFKVAEHSFEEPMPNSR